MATNENNNLVLPLAKLLLEEADALRGLTPDRRTLSTNTKKSGSQEWR